MVCLLGPSGCGKTTLLRLVAGFEEPDAGEIYLIKRLVSRPGLVVPPEQRHVGMVFQDYALFPHMTVSQNIQFGLFRWPAAWRRTRLTEMLRLVGLEGMAERYPHEISGGQQQRVALARALAPAPQLLLLDEPFSNLDVHLRQQLREEVQAILVQAGITTISGDPRSGRSAEFALIPWRSSTRARWSSTPLQTRSCGAHAHALCRPVHWAGTFSSVVKSMRACITTELGEVPYASALSLTGDGRQVEAPRPPRTCAVVQHIRTAPRCRWSTPAFAARASSIRYVFPLAPPSVRCFPLKSSCARGGRAGNLAARGLWWCFHGKMHQRYRPTKHLCIIDRPRQQPLPVTYRP